ncbi:MAG: hypothetical protein HYV40_06795 [Candidatus Levybacteria bacterium]|nr:hypothetical protein [Candidatus Levybacteria bacterium]
MSENGRRIDFSAARRKRGLAPKAEDTQSKEIPGLLLLSVTGLPEDALTDPTVIVDFSFGDIHPIIGIEQVNESPFEESFLYKQLRKPLSLRETGLLRISSPVRKTAAFTELSFSRRKNVWEPLSSMVLEPTDEFVLSLLGYVDELGDTERRDEPKTEETKRFLLRYQTKRTLLQQMQSSKGKELSEVMRAFRDILREEYREAEERLKVERVYIHDEIEHKNDVWDIFFH